MKLHKIIKRIVIICICIGVVGLLVLLGINAYIKGTVKDCIVESNSMPEGEVDCILVLGCQVKESGEPSHMLRDRLQKGVERFFHHNYKTGANLSGRFY